VKRHLSKNVRNNL